MPSHIRFAVVCPIAAALLGGCVPLGGLTPQAREDLGALRDLAEKVPDAALRGQMLVRLWSLEGELTASRSPLAPLLGSPPPGVQKLVYHHFACLGYRNAEGKYDGLEVRVQPLDARGQVERVRGAFRFELYQFQPANERRKGRRLAQWDVALERGDQEGHHWQRYSESYVFRLRYPAEIAPETKFVLVSVFTDRTGRRVFLEDVVTYLQ